MNKYKCFAVMNRMYIEFKGQIIWERLVERFAEKCRVQLNELEVEYIVNNY